MLIEIMCGWFLEDVPMMARQGTDLNGTKRLLGNLKDGLLNNISKRRIVDDFETAAINNPVLLDLILCVATHPKRMSRGFCKDYIWIPWFLRN